VAEGNTGVPFIWTGAGFKGKEEYKSGLAEGNKKGEDPLRGRVNNPIRTNRGDEKKKTHTSWKGRTYMKCMTPTSYNSEIREQKNLQGDKWKPRRGAHKEKRRSMVPRGPERRCGLFRGKKRKVPRRNGRKKRSRRCK